MDLAGLYQEVILEHNRSPRNFGALDNASGCAHGRNPVCGDEVTVWLREDSEGVRDVTFTGSGCFRWAGGASGRGYAIQGNILSGAKVVAAMEKMNLAWTPANLQAEAELQGKIRAYQTILAAHEEALATTIAKENTYVDRSNIDAQQQADYRDLFQDRE